MRLNLQSDYALRLLMCLAASDGRLITIRQVAERYNISENHLMKVAHVLGREGFIETVRGRNGGLRLARKPAAIGIGDVVRRTEADLALVECFPGGAAGCFIVPACRLKGVLREALDAFMAVLDRYTIGDLTSNNPRLRALLDSKAA